MGILTNNFHRNNVPLRSKWPKPDDIYTFNRFSCAYVVIQEEGFVVEDTNLTAQCGFDVGISNIISQIKNTYVIHSSTVYKWDYADNLWITYRTGVNATMFGFNGDLYIRKAVNSLSRVVNDVDTPVTGVGNYAPVVSALYDGVMYGVSSAMRVVVINNNNTATLVTPPSSNNVYGLRTGGASTSNGALFVCDTSFLLVWGPTITDMKVELYSNILPGNTAIDSSGDPYNYTINPCAFTYNDMVYAVIKGSIYEISIDSSHNIAAILFYEHRIDLSDPSSNSHVIYDIAFYNNTIYYSLTYESIGVWYLDSFMSHSNRSQTTIDTDIAWSLVSDGDWLYCACNGILSQGLKRLKWNDLITENRGYAYAYMAVDSNNATRAYFNSEWDDLGFVSTITLDDYLRMNMAEVISLWNNIFKGKFGRAINWGLQKDFINFVYIYDTTQCALPIYNSPVYEKWIPLIYIDENNEVSYPTSETVILRKSENRAWWGSYASLFIHMYPYDNDPKYLDGSNTIRIAKWSIKSDGTRYFDSTVDNPWSYWFWSNYGNNASGSYPSWMNRKAVVPLEVVQEFGNWEWEFPLIINETKNYFVPIGADDNFNLWIDNVLIINREIMDIGNINFQYAHIWEIPLTKGNHKIKCYVSDVRSVAWGFAMEIWDVTLEDIKFYANLWDTNRSTTFNRIENFFKPRTVFSTENYRYGVTTLKCGNGFNLEYINDVPVCAISNSVIVDVSGWECVKLFKRIMLSGAPLDVDGNLCSSTGKLQAIAIIDILFPMYSVNDIIMAENRNYQVYEVITAPDLSTWDHNDIFYWNSYECIKWVGV